MDNHKELIERLKIDAEWAEGQEWETPLCLWDDLTDAVSTLAELAEENARLRAELEQVKRERDGIKVAFEDIASKPDCNTCCDRTCMYRPRVGEATRFNCLLWCGRNPK